ncbi:uncharacterized protein LOC115889761 [Sitophilus oryzae]|uniref:Uncharacterized protein LOC115889761 n=1 Tax=Sitophilus oryzae TaxID=7048 RepID=A0A6J2YQZ7_SITOR|nr:uncharacterized protein LOC115889761 [Sitophilus oryzae]XP_030765692.1 uncharacterized protein LOC115889761 [Sitophilus oryzae]
MSGGVGRGRGWLNLNTPNKYTPGIDEMPSPSASKHLNTNEIDDENKYYTDVPQDFSDLINAVKVISLEDDGIKFNQKMKYITEIWVEKCRNSDDVEKSYDLIHELCLTDEDFSSKVVHLFAAQSFSSQEVHKNNLRSLLITKLQENFEDREQMMSSNIIAFRNSIQLMGNVYNKLRSLGGEPFRFLILPLFTYFEMLLELKHIEDLKLFAMQLNLNGASIKNTNPEKISEILVKVRDLLCSEDKLSREGKLWLLLSLEVANTRFTLLPTDIHNFYVEQLGDQAMAYFQGNHGALTVQTIQNNKKLDSYQSAVNVLQLSTSDLGSDSFSNSVSDAGSIRNISDYSSRSSSNREDSKNFNSANKKDNQSKKGGKTGRPILGVGVRLNKARPTDFKNETGGWTTKSPSDKNPENSRRDKDKNRGTQGGPKKLLDKKKLPPKLSNKGWQHDDRFETDYS